MAGRFDHLLGKHLSIISKAGARYTGVFVGADSVESTITLEDIYFHGTEDRPVPKKAPGGQRLGGPVSFKTPSIVHLEEAKDHPSTVVEEEEAFVDPALPSNITLEPPKPAAAQSSQAPPNLPRKPSADSASTALDRVQHSLSQLSTGPPPNAGPSRGRGRGGYHQQSRPAPEVPDTDFDFSGTAAFQSQREKATRDSAVESDDGVEDLGEIEGVHPAALGATSPPAEENGGPGRKGSQSASYEKDDFFDSLSGANEQRGAGRVNRNMERERNLDAFGDTGDSVGGPGGPGGFGGRGGFRPRVGFAARGAWRGGGEFGGGGRGGRGGGGYGGGYGGRGGYGGQREGGYGGQRDGGYGGQREGGYGGRGGGFGGERRDGYGGGQRRGRGGYGQYQGGDAEQ